MLLRSYLGIILKAAIVNARNQTPRCLFSGDITASGDARLNLSGASSVQLQGSASDVVIAASGASRVELDNFPVDNANVKLSGASGATVNLDGRLDADLSGASRLSYIGEPTMGDIDTSGGSSVSKK